MCHYSRCALSKLVPPLRGHTLSNLKPFHLGTSCVFIILMISDFTLDLLQRRYLQRSQLSDCVFVKLLFLMSATLWVCSCRLTSPVQPSDRERKQTVASSTSCIASFRPVWRKSPVVLRQDIPGGHQMASSVCTPHRLVMSSVCQGRTPFRSSLLTLAQLAVRNTKPRCRPHALPLRGRVREVWTADQCPDS